MLQKRLANDNTIVKGKGKGKKGRDYLKDLIDVGDKFNAKGSLLYMR